MSGLDGHATEVTAGDTSVHTRELVHILPRAVSKSFVSLTDIADFVTRTNGRGVPLRIAIDRASKRYGVERDLVKAILPVYSTSP